MAALDRRLTRCASESTLASLLRWLDPRSHRWRAVVAAGGLAGLLLAAVELFGEGQPATTDQVATVAALFVGLSSFR